MEEGSSMPDYVAALTPAQPAAPHGVAYAELPEPIWRTAQGVAFSERQLYDFADRTHALRASNGQAPAQPSPTAQAAPAGTTLPEGWVSLTITHEGQYTEEIAYGPQRMMDRLSKWLVKYFAKTAAPAQIPDLQPLHNLLYLAQRQTSLGAMQCLVGEARLELAKVRDAAPTPQTALWNPLEGGTPETALQMAAVIAHRDADRAARAQAGSVLEDADPIRALIAQHAAILDQNESAYFELCYHRVTGWMAWITDKPLCMPPVVNQDRKVLAQGQGETADEACTDAARKQGGA